MFGLGFSEIIVLGVLALILLGPEQLPDLARKLGRFINELKRTTDGLKDEFKNSGLDPKNLLEELKRENPTPPPSQAATPETKPSGNDTSGKT
jgi:sec-independent protein translocase protein TatB